MNTIKITPFIEGVNDTPRIVELLRSCPDGSTLKFEKGRYNFYAEGAYTDYFCPACNQSGDKQVIFPILRKKNITIDGSGSEFIFHDRVFPFIAQFTGGITLKNFSVDFSFPRYCVSEAVCEKGGILLKMDKQALHCSANADGNLIFNAGGTIFDTREKQFFMQQGRRVCYLAAGKHNYSTDNLPAGVLFCDAIERDNGIFLRFGENSDCPFTDGKLVLNYDEDRQNDIMFFDRCSNIKISDVEILSGAGMGIVSQLCKNIELERVKLLPGRKLDAIYSTTADGLFFTQDSGKVWIHDCVVKSTMDDAVSIHNVYAKVDGILTSNKIRAKYQHPSHSGFNPFIPGDSIQISDAETRNVNGLCKVKSSHIENDTYAVVLELCENIDGVIEDGDYLENHERSPEVIIENCLFDSFPSIRLASSKKIIFRQNTVKNGNGVTVNDLMRYWNTYGLSNDVYLIGNTISNCGIGFSTCVERAEKCTEKHGRVHLTKNLFTDCNVAISLESVNEPILADNAFIRVGERERITDCFEVCRHGIPQLLMRRDTPESFEPATPLPDGYRKFVFHRGGDEHMSLEEYKAGWFKVCPHWSEAEFEHFYSDGKIPDDGFFLILNDRDEIVAHSNIQLDEHKPGSATVHFVEVDPNERGKKLGYAVSEIVLDYVQSHTIPVTYLTTDEFRMRAIKIYLQLGFRPVLEDEGMLERWAPILRVYGCNEVYDKNEKLINI